MELIKGSESFSCETQSKIGILAIQGFSGATGSIVYLAKFFAKQGFNVECPRLTGHGTNWQDLEKTLHTDWINDVEKALDILKKRVETVFVVGLSMGGALALYLTSKYPDIKGIILINNALILKHPKFFFIPFLKNFVRTTTGIGSDIKDPNEKEICYEAIPIKGVYQFLKTLEVGRKNISKVNQPIIIFKSKEDHVIPCYNATYTYKKVSSKEKELIWLTNSYHVATMDYDKDLICQKSLDFVNKYDKI